MNGKTVIVVQGACYDCGEPAVVKLNRRKLCWDCYQREARKVRGDLEVELEIG